MELNVIYSSPIYLRTAACWVCAAIIFSVLASGCSQGIERIPVRGRVLIDGEPLTYGYVTVVPVGARPAMGELDAEGRFELMTYQPGDGTTLGTHKITVNSGEVLDAVRVKWHAPKSYSGLSTSGLQIEVTAELQEEVLIELTWDGRTPYIESARIE